MSTARRAIRTLLLFGWTQALCCLFPVAIFSAMAVTKVVDIPFIPRYDFILLICVAMQIVMVALRLETADELKVITLFHLIGLGLELFKVHMGSWSYPEEAWSKLGGVPLYSGFMYASVASYICQAWRRFDLRFERWPKAVWSMGIAVAIYANFFTHHYMADLRWAILAGLLVIFYRTVVTFKVGGRTLRMHALVSYALIAFFIWLAENISTFLGAWTYPNQERHWNVVHLGKLSSWFMLVIISIIIVVQLKELKYRVLPRAEAREQPSGRPGADPAGPSTPGSVP
ncbi:DUF817 domain-containing protein [Cohnella thailandensis]|uniref:DUF817 domain-containing protein n=1 Tax=Cohnella thailandensis TaxID=557557 RepID=A0A841SSC1_9BACL|nr:DUF817 domain-containing protein [Cohnella thailandensis]MBB6632517.1 DUF817 domain-containing protein [Cohnella thailandensis]MBP1971809.1 uncharacterized membrane protein YoaT (DUF817 family) [Cohnella thailandensis]